MVIGKFKNKSVLLYYRNLILEIIILRQILEVKKFVHTALEEFVSNVKLHAMKWHLGVTCDVRMADT